MTTQVAWDSSSGNRDNTVETGSRNEAPMGQAVECVFLFESRKVSVSDAGWSPPGISGFINLIFAINHRYGSSAHELS